MNTFDISPLFRSTVGVDRLFDQLANTWSLDNHLDQSWPQYDVARTGDEDYRITVALPGYHRDDIHLETRGNRLTIKGERNSESQRGEFLYRSIGGQSFVRTFQLADYVKVANAKLVNGLLQVDLKRELPEAMLPRKIEISTDEGAQTIEHRLDERIGDKAA